MLTATTSKSGPPSLACKLSSAGISLRQGTHQVAHRLTSTVLPRHSESFRGLPSASSKARSGSRSGLVAMVNGAGAGGIAARPTLEAAEAIDPGKADQRADQDGADGNRDPARGGRARGGRLGHIVCHPVSDTAMQSSCYGRNPHGVSPVSPINARA